MRDDFYTPGHLAKDLVRLSVQDAPKRIADFAVGGGSLLTAASSTWPTAMLYGVDVDQAAISETRALHPKFRAYNVDFLSVNGLQRTKALHRKIDVIMLNPPFSCRGASFELMTFENAKIKCSKAMAFVLRSCRYLSSNGEIIAIVPRSCLFSQKDEDARNALSQGYELEDFGRYESPRFKKASVSVHLVKVIRRSESKNQKICFSNLQQFKPHHGFRVVLMRGSHPVSMGEMNTDAPSLIHTTNLFNSEISISRLRATKFNKTISGEVLMIPRVARPNKGKLAVGTFVRPVVPSDCVICAKTLPHGNEVRLQRHLVAFWDILKNTYSGTCASYLTMDAFQKFLVGLGYEVEISNNSEIWNPTGAKKANDKPLWLEVHR